MPTLVVVIGLVLAVVVVAYVLGRYIRRRSENTPVAASLARLATPQPRLEQVADPETRAVVGWLLSQAFEQTGLHVADDPLAYGRIVNAAQKAVEELKTQDATTIALPFLTADAHGPKHLECRLTREVIQELIRS
jgi:hypothetical protein